MAQLLNTAVAAGTFDGVPVDISTDLIVELTALAITKRADKAIWVNGELEYTIVVSNIDTRDPSDPDDPGLPVINVNVTDIIEPTIATLVANSVEIDGNPAIENTDYTFNTATGLLTVSFASMAPSSSHIITFRVEFV